MLMLVENSQAPKSDDEISVLVNVLIGSFVKLLSSY